jgi:signal peptide peptidase SppA
MSDFPHLRAAIYSVPWAIMPERLEAIAEVFERRLQGIRKSPEEIAAIKGERAGVNGGLELRALSDPSAPLAAAGQAAPSGGLIAVINMHGIVAQHASQVDDISGPGGTSTERVGASFRTAMSDPNVKAIVLNIDSPGGSVNGVQALSDEIYRSRGKKPIVAQVNSLAASAAYWIAASADEIVVTPGGNVGSIGVYGTHKDVSVAAEKEGVKVTFISAGKYKVEGHPFEPLSSEAAQAMQKSVDAYYADFLRAVAQGRGVSTEDVRTGFGEGRIVKDKEAVRERMADRVDTLDGTLKRLAKGQRPSERAKAAAPAWPENFASYEPPAIRVETDRETQTFVAERPWPQSIILADVFLDGHGRPVALESDTTFTINVANGMAVYEIVGSRTMGDEGTDFAAVLKDSLYEPMPSAAAQQSAEDRDAFRRRRHAARLRSLSI